MDPKQSIHKKIYQIKSFFHFLNLKKLQLWIYDQRWNNDHT